MRRTADQRWLGVQEILNFAENYVRRAKKPALGEFLEQLALKNRDDDPEQPGSRDAVVCDQGYATGFVHLAQQVSETLEDTCAGHDLVSPGGERQRGPVHAHRLAEPLERWRRCSCRARKDSRSCRLR